MKKQFKIVDEAGLHARPASLLVSKASTFPNDINITFKGSKNTLKSILILMSMGIQQNDEIEIEVIGEDAEEVMASLEKVLVDNQLV